MDAADSDENGGLFNIDFSSADEAAAEQQKKPPRDFQSEADSQQQLREWRPKVEKGELWKTLKLPIDSPSKPVSQTILHSIEELYFYRRYEEARNFTEEAMRGKGLMVEFKKTLESY